MQVQLLKCRAYTLSRWQILRDNWYSESICNLTFVSYTKRTHRQCFESWWSRYDIRNAKDRLEDFESDLLEERYREKI